MTVEHEELKNPKARLPDLALRSVGSGSYQKVWAPGRRSRLIVLFHAADCRRCWAYVGETASRADALEDWDCDVLVVLPGRLSADARDKARPESVILLEDPDCQLASRLGVQIPAVVIADQWGEVRMTGQAGPSHRFEAVENVIQWLQFMAIECPECQGEAF